MLSLGCLCRSESLKAYIFVLLSFSQRSSPLLSHIITTSSYHYYDAISVYFSHTLDPIQLRSFNNISLRDWGDHPSAALLFLRLPSVGFSEHQLSLSPVYMQNSSKVKMPRAPTVVWAPLTLTSLLKLKNGNGSARTNLCGATLVSLGKIYLTISPSRRR